MESEPEAYVDESLRSIGISPRERLAHIEDALVQIDKKLDVRFDAVERRLNKVEAVQAGQASTAEFVTKATELANEAAKKAAVLADEATKTAAGLAKDAAGKAAILADDQKKFDLNLIALNARLDGFDRKVAWFTGAAAVLVFVSGFIGYLFHIG